MAGPIDVCNDAIIAVSGKPITSFNDATTEATTCRQLYAQKRDAIFREHPWNCLIERADLNEIEDLPAFGFDHQYQLPPECLRVLTLNDIKIPWMRNGYVYSTTIPIRYKIEGRKLLTDEDKAEILFVSRIEDVNQWDALLRELVAARLAAEIAFPVTKNAQLVKTMWDLYDIKLRDARRVDGMEGTTEPIDSDPIGDARRHGV